MSQEAVESFLGRIITDNDFRRHAVVSLEHACAKVGLKLSTEEISLLKILDFPLFSLIAESVDDALRRS